MEKSSLIPPGSRLIVAVNWLSLFVAAWLFVYWVRYSAMPAYEMVSFGMAFGIVFGLSLCWVVMMSVRIPLYIVMSFVFALCSHDPEAPWWARGLLGALMLLGEGSFYRSRWTFGTLRP